MTEWVPTFDYPAEEWLLVDVNVPDGAERAAQQVADRGGRQNKRYAKAVYPELKDAWQDLREEGAEPVVVYVPQVRRNTEPLSPASVHAVPCAPDFERSMEAIAEYARLPLPDPALTYAREPQTTVVELPAGPACRVHRALLADTGYRGEQLATEHVQHYVLSDAYPEAVILLSATWISGTAGEGMTELADRIAATLTLKPRGSEEAPRPVLATPGARIVFDEVQIGKGLRPLAQHGFVTIDRDQGVLSLLGSDQQVIASAPVSEVTAWPIRASLNTAVGLEINGTTYNAAPGRGSYPKAFTLPTDLMKGHSAADQLLHLLEASGGKQR
ncbi:hypothetical protein [Streptomyces sp. NBC_01803]|uniref:hypothetical protein n=1 Tax=Streptomyces sp. NBC_01803 TaxID=2975946 RepID=UPI002DDA2516|nr:hypothetical protein [Streptomyces sp. NBC_01803]WSA42753.1 hypothetical protein OIE51_00125 [Streptomyces sp. NBC_01803]